MSTVRRLGSGEWALLCELRLAALLDAPAAFGSSYARERGQDEAAWRERLAGSVWFVAERAGLVRGAASDVVGRRNLHSMWVHPAHRGAGVGRALIAAVRAWAQADGADELALWVVEGNAAAVRLYTGEGFVPTGVRQALRGDAAAAEEQWLLSLLP